MYEGKKKGWMLVLRLHEADIDMKDTFQTLLTIQHYCFLAQKISNSSIPLSMTNDSFILSIA